MQEHDELIASRYQRLRLLGQGGFGQTWLVYDKEGDREVVLKQLDMRRAQDWKSVELFEREAQVLRGLHHEAIPKYLGDFRLETEGRMELFLVQELARGQDLRAWIEELGWRPTTDEIIALTAQLLKVLIYLHALVPPVIHRDLKPQNIMRDAQGRISLVDFGSVKASWQELGRGSTVAGTFGYMAPEQLRGVGVAQTDLYGVGTTLLYLITRQDPSQLPSKGLNIDFRAVTQLPEPLAAWLDRCLEADYERRFPSAQAALDALLAPQQGAAPTPLPSLPNDAPPAVKVEPEAMPDQRRYRQEPLDPEHAKRTFKMENPGMALLGVLGLAGLVAGSLFLHSAGMLVLMIAVAILPLIMIFGGVTPKDDLAHPRTWLIKARGHMLAGGAATAAFGLMSLHSEMVYSPASMVIGAIGMAIFAVVGFMGMGEWLSLRRLLRFEQQANFEHPWLVENNVGSLRVDALTPGASVRFHGPATHLGLGTMGLAMLCFGYQVAHQVLTGTFSQGWAAFAGIVGLLGALIAYGNRQDNKRNATIFKDEQGKLMIDATLDGTRVTGEIAQVRVIDVGLKHGHEPSQIFSLQVLAHAHPKEEPKAAFELNNLPLAQANLLGISLEHLIMQVEPDYIPELTLAVRAEEALASPQEEVVLGFEAAAAGEQALAEVEAQVEVVAQSKGHEQPW